MLRPGRPNRTDTKWIRSSSPTRGLSLSLGAASSGLCFESHALSTLRRCRQLDCLEAWIDLHDGRIGQQSDGQGRLMDG
jgi:hypothetical protein